MVFFSVLLDVRCVVPFSEDDAKHKGWNCQRKKQWTCRVYLKAQNHKPVAGVLLSSVWWWWLLLLLLLLLWLWWRLSSFASCLPNGRSPSCMFWLTTRKLIGRSSGGKHNSFKLVQSGRMQYVIMFSAVCTNNWCLNVSITTYGTALLIFCLCFTPSWSQPSLQVWALIYCLWIIPSKEISEIKKDATPKQLTLRLRKNLTDYGERSVNVFLFFPVLLRFAFLSTWFQHYAGFWSLLPVSAADVHFHFTVFHFFFCHLISVSHTDDCAAL